MRELRDLLVHWIMGLVGIVSGVLSVIAFAIAAFVPALLGIVALVLSPLRAISDQLRRT